MRTVRKDRLLYQSKPNSNEWCAHHVIGCSHGCKYPCYVMALSDITLEEWIDPIVVANARELLADELGRFSGRIRNVSFCYTTDAFMMGQDDVAALTIDLIRELNNQGIACTLLTKGVYPAGDIARLSHRNWYGVSLSSLSEQFREEWEPGAASIEDRIESLHRLHRSGLYTFVALEPWPTPNILHQDIMNVLERIKWVDKMVFGPIGFNAKADRYFALRPGIYHKFYAEQLAKATEFCASHNIGLDCRTGAFCAAAINNC